MITVIGGGISGLSLAYLLQAKGYDLAVIEKQPQLGGNCSWTNLGDFTVDIFYHVITNRDTQLLDLIQELGLEDRLFAVNLKMGFYQRGRLYPISTPREFLTFAPLSLRERIRLGVSIVGSKAIKDWRALEGVTACVWLSRLGGRRNYEKLWRPIMQNKFGPVTDEIVATDMWSRINRVAGIRNKKFQQSAYQIKGAFKTFFEALEKKLREKGVNIVKGTAVTKIKSAQNRIQAVVLNNQKEVACNKVISTISLPDFVKLLPDGYKEYARALSQIKYLHNVCLILRLKEQFSPYYQLNLGEDGLPFTGIIGADALYPPSDFAQSYILYISKYFLQDNGVLAMDKQALLEHYLPYLKKICPGFREDWILDMALTKRTNVEPIHSLHYSKLIPGFQTPILNLYLLSMAQIYPEATVLAASVKYAKMLVNKLF